MDFVLVRPGRLFSLGGVGLGGGGARVVSIGPAAVRSMLCQLSLAGMFGMFVVLGCVSVRSVGFCFRRFRCLLFFFGVFGFFGFFCLCGGFFLGCFRLLRDWRRAHATFFG